MRERENLPEKGDNTEKQGNKFQKRGNKIFFVENKQLNKN